MIIGYARVSTIDQSLELQLDELNRYGCEKIFTEKQSGMKDDRLELAKAIDMLRADDKFVVYKFDRMARSTLKLISTLNALQAKGVEVVSIKDNIDTSTAAGKAMFGMLAVFAEFERNVIVERTRAGLAASRARGRMGGRPKTDRRKLSIALKMYQSGDYSVPEITEETGVSKATLYRAIKETKVEG